jgi:hypothetical protein
VPGAPDSAKLTPQENKNIPKSGEFDGHTALEKFFSIVGITRSRRALQRGRACARLRRAQVTPDFSSFLGSTRPSAIKRYPFPLHSRHPLPSNRPVALQCSQGAGCLSLIQNPIRFPAGLALLPATYRGSCRADLTLSAPRCAPARSKPH